ncbi:uncharacterized protein [Drosophila bipectinata]|uniref:uncharacterized protein n=1 Tax=Drosophila bipectinata TaxID=42026 RepID=UPI0038B2A940
MKRKSDDEDCVSDMEVDGMKKKDDKKTKQSAVKTAKIIKPPPIFIPNVFSIKGLSKDISRLLGRDVSVTYKASTNNTIRVMTPDKDTHSTLKKFLSENNHRYHTFQPRDERAYRIVVKGLHFSPDPEGFSSHGHKVCDIHNSTQKAVCLHCDGPHAASYKGCPAYKKAKSMLAPKQTDPRSQQPQFSKINPNISYASAVKNGAPQFDSNPNPDPSLPSNPMGALMARMESMFERMMEKVLSQIAQMMATLDMLSDWQKRWNIAVNNENSTATKSSTALQSHRKTIPSTWDSP